MSSINAREAFERWCPRFVSRLLGRALAEGWEVQTARDKTGPLSIYVSARREGRCWDMWRVYSCAPPGDLSETAEAAVDQVAASMAAAEGYAVPSAPERVYPEPTVGESE